MRDFEPEDDSFSNEYEPMDSPKDFESAIPNQLLDFVLRNTSC